MKKRNLIIYNLIFLLSVLVTADIVKYQLTSEHLLTFRDSTQAVSVKESCASTQATQRPPTTDPQLKAVADYETACSATFIDQMMIFTNMPVSTDKAREAADKMTVRLNAFKDFGITPVVVMEPDSEWGLVDFHEFATGFYDDAMRAYFAKLKSNGISDQNLGIWIPFPEPQQDFWNNNKEPDDFANSVNRYFKALRAEFPAGKTAILLDSQVGEDDQASQLLAYTRLVDDSLVDIVGLQGFPWHPLEDGDSRSSVISASSFVPAYLVEEIARSLNTKKVYLNTGTYRHRRAESGGNIAVTTQERQSTLQSIVYESQLLKNAGYEVTVNVFAENKLEAKEGVDWSYWQAGSPNNSEQTPLFTQFIKDLKKDDIKISIFDSRQ